MGIGLALSGGGFRATLFHLGVIQLLRRARILPQITHVVSVSGGSIVAAHVALNWDAYSGQDDQKFEKAVRRLTEFVGKDIRNRIAWRAMLRLPFQICPSIAKKFVPNFRLSTTDFLIHYYNSFLQDGLDVPPTIANLRAFPPLLHILTTNLTRGEYCSFSRNGFTRFPQYLASLPPDNAAANAAAVPIALAVAASSAFPAFFPGIAIDAPWLEINQGSYELFSDAGVFDNLGLCLARKYVETGRCSRFIVSDAGRPFQGQFTSEFPGLPVETALRATEVIQNRVARLEEQASIIPGLLHLKITDTIHAVPNLDVPILDCQYYLPWIRTDFDAFNDVEGSNLLRHGFFVARKRLLCHAGRIADRLSTAAQRMIQTPDQARRDKMIVGAVSRLRTTALTIGDALQIGAEQAEVAKFR
jgi:predicted acylesterase/phospholipase RssA